MIPDKILYTDGHDVTVTDSTLLVKNHEYKLNGVTRCALMVLQPKRAPGALLLLIGLTFVALGILNMMSPYFAPVVINNKAYNMDLVAIWAGGFLALVGIVALAIVRERYAVRIATAEGEKDAVVSSRKEYVTQIVDAINQAVSFVRTKTASRYFTVKGTNS